MATWKEFAGKANTPDVLVEKAHKLFSLIMKTAEQAADNSAEYVDMVTEDVDKIVTEFAILFLHLTDRIAFNILAVEQRDQFIDALNLPSVSSLKSKEAMNLFNARVLFYGSLQEVTPRNTFVEGNVYGEFTKIIMQHLSMDLENPDEIMRVLLKNSEMINWGMKELNVKGLLEAEAQTN